MPLVRENKPLLVGENCSHVAGYRHLDMGDNFVFVEDSEKYAEDNKLDFTPFNYCPFCGTEITYQKVRTVKRTSKIVTEEVKRTRYTEEVIE